MAGLLRQAGRVVSQCGYNSALEILASGRPALFVPFARGQESEQTMRARQFADLGLATVAARSRAGGACAGEALLTLEAPSRSASSRHRRRAKQRPNRWGSWRVRAVEHPSRALPAGGRVLPRRRCGLGAGRAGRADRACSGPHVAGRLRGHPGCARYADRTAQSCATARQSALGLHQHGYAHVNHEPGQSAQMRIRRGSRRSTGNGRYHAGRERLAACWAHRTGSSPRRGTAVRAPPRAAQRHRLRAALDDRRREDDALIIPTARHARLGARAARGAA